MRFIRELEKTGDVVQACVSSGLSAEQFHKMYKSDESFRREVDGTLTGHELTLDRRINALGKQKLLELLENGSTVQRIKRRVIYDEDDNLKQTEVSTESVHFPTPEWAIKHALAQRDRVENALMVLADECLIPVDKVRAIMSQIVESKANIRQVLGESQASSEELSRQAIVQAQADLLGVSVDKL